MVNSCQYKTLFVLLEDGTSEKALPALARLLIIGKLDLNAIYAIHAVEEEDKDEDKGNLLRKFQPCSLRFTQVEGRVLYLHPILQFCDDWAFGDEREHLPLQSERERDYEAHEKQHLCHQKQEHLADLLVFERRRFRARNR